MSWLSKAQKKAIAEAYSRAQQQKAELTIEAIAKRFGVHPRTVQKIVKKRAHQNAHSIQSFAMQAE